MHLLHALVPTAPHPSLAHGVAGGAAAGVLRAAQVAAAAGAAAVLRCDVAPPWSLPPPRDNVADLAPSIVRVGGVGVGREAGRGQDSSERGFRGCARAG